MNDKIIHLIETTLKKSSDRLSFLLFALSGLPGDKLELSDDETRGCVDVLSQISNDLRWLRRVVDQYQRSGEKSTLLDETQLEVGIEVGKEIKSEMGMDEEFQGGNSSTDNFEHNT